MTMRPTRRTFFGGLAAFLFAGFVGKRLALADAPPPQPQPQPLPTTATWNYYASSAGPAVVVSISTYTYSGRLLTRVEGQGNTGTWNCNGTK